MPSSRRSRISLLLALLGSGAAGADTDIYRCRDHIAPLYQATECPQSGSKLALQVPLPDEPDRKLADLTREREREFVRQVEAERERRTRQAETERTERTLADQRQVVRCQRYISQAEKLEDEAGSIRRAARRKRLKDVRARELRDRYFSECLGTR